MKTRDTHHAATASLATSRAMQSRTRKRAHFIFVSIALFLSVASARGDCTLPLQGYCHANRYMPVRVDGDAIELKTLDTFSSVVIPGVPRVVPVWVGATANDLAIGETHVKLNLLGDDKLVALVGRADESDARPLFAGARVVALPVDDAFFSGPPAAWQALDGVVFDFTSMAKLDDAKRAALLATGMTLAAKSTDKPDDRWPWSRDRNLWTLRADPVGPGDGLINPDAFGPIDAIEPGLPSRDRRTIAAVTLLLLAILIATRFVRWRLRYLLGVTAVSILFAIVWRHARSPVASGQGSIVIQSAALRQRDVWVYEVGRAAGVHSVSWLGFTRPVFPNETAMEQSRLKLVCDATMRFEYRTVPGHAAAFVKSDVTANDRTPVSTAASPMESLAKDIYVRPDVSIAGTTRAAGGWPGVLLLRSK